MTSRSRADKSSCAKISSSRSATGSVTKTWLVGTISGLLTGLVAKLRPAVDGVSSPSASEERSSANPAFVQDVATTNVGLTVQNIRERSAVLREMEEAGEIKIVGAMYDVGTGEAKFID